MSAAFFSLDGIDGTGKSTQCRLLANWLRERGFRVTTCVDPGGTDLGAKLREILLSKETRLSMRAEALLFMASRAELVETVIRPALTRGEIVVSDRFLLANVVYQGYAGGLPPNDLLTVGQFATGGLLPDLTLVLDLPFEMAQQRRSREADRMESRGLEYNEKVRNGFLIEAAANPERIKVIDASPSVETVHATIIHEVEAILTSDPQIRLRQSS
jgi:dTMP kinase